MTELLKRLRRVEVRIGLALGASISLLVLGLLAVVFLVSSHEAAEVWEDLLHAELLEAKDDLASAQNPASEEQRVGDVALRLISPDGTTTQSGDWPQGRGYTAGTSSLRLAFASPADYLAEGLTLPDGLRLEGAAPLAGFVAERREQLLEMLESFTLGLLAIFAVSVYLTRLALAPLRNIRRALESVGENNLGARLPLAGTDDDIDRLRAALNRVFERLERAFGRLRSYGADVAHELRTPLNRIVNLVDAGLLLPRPADVETTLEAVRSATQQMQRLIEDMLLLARGEEQRLLVVLARVDLAKLLADLVELYAPASLERQVDLEFIRESGPGEIDTDRGLVQRAVANLLDNALRHTPTEGHIRLALCGSAEHVSITVDDSGPGVAPEERERVFERFVQLDPARTGGGAGLGLPIALMIARLLGGNLTVSRSQLGGARFELCLPAESSSDPRPDRDSAFRR